MRLTEIEKICNLYMYFLAGLGDSGSSHVASSKSIQEKILSDMNKEGSYSRDSKYYGVII